MLGCNTGGWDSCTASAEKCVKYFWGIFLMDSDVYCTYIYYVYVHLYTYDPLYQIAPAPK